MMLARSWERPSQQAKDAYFLEADFLGRSVAWMFGRTPPDAIVTEPRSLFSSSSLRTASWMWRGTMRVFLLSRAALPASSRISAQRYSRTAPMYAGTDADARGVLALAEVAVQAR